MVEVAPDGSFTLIKPTGGLTEGEGEEVSLHKQYVTVVDLSVF